jgi:hypothetical protein
MVFDAFQKKANAFIEDGVSLTNILPAKDNFAAQLKNIFDSGQRFDAVYIDGEEYITEFVEQAELHGMQCGKDYDLHVSTVNPRIKPADYPFPLTFHVQQGEKMGIIAWEATQKLIGKKKVDKQIKIPYLKMN